MGDYMKGWGVGSYPDGYKDQREGEDEWVREVHKVCQQKRGKLSRKGISDTERKWGLCAGEKVSREGAVC